MRAAAISIALAACSSQPSPPTKPVEHHTAPARVRVILYGVTDFTGDDDRLRLQPMACALDGVLTVGLRCGEAMPAAIDAKIIGGAMIHAERTTVDYEDTAGGQMYKAPRGPECCSYNTCRGDTIAYLAAPHTALPVPPPSGRYNLADYGGHHVIAVWPADADGGFLSYAIGAGAGGDGPPGFDVEQRVTGDEGTLIAGRPVDGCASCAGLLFRRGDGPWSAVGNGGRGADGFIVMVTTDLDGDGRHEALVRERWRNGYGAMFLGADWSRPLHRFGCGSI